MFYRVTVGKLSRKQKMTGEIDFVVSFDGTAFNLQRQMSRRYRGFDIVVSEIETVIDEAKEDTRKLTASGVFEHNVVSKSKYRLTGLIPEEMENRVKSLRCEIKALEEEVSSHVKENLSKRIEVESVKGVSFANKDLDTLNILIAINGELYLDLARQ